MRITRGQFMTEINALMAEYGFDDPGAAVYLINDDRERPHNDALLHINGVLTADEISFVGDCLRLYQFNRPDK